MKSLLNHQNPLELQYESDNVIFFSIKSLLNNQKPLSPTCSISNMASEFLSVYECFKQYIFLYPLGTIQHIAEKQTLN